MEKKSGAGAAWKKKSGVPSPAASNSKLKKHLKNEEDKKTDKESLATTLFDLIWYFELVILTKTNYHFFRPLIYI